MRLSRTLRPGSALAAGTLILLLGLSCVTGLHAEAQGVRQEESAEWLLAAVLREADLIREPLADYEVAMLRIDVPTFPSSASDRALNNKVVRIARSAMDRAKAAGVPTIEARPGLRIPADWLRHYEVIYEGNLPWVLSGILQNAMIANPFAGETVPWRSE